MGATRALDEGRPTLATQGQRTEGGGSPHLSLRGRGNGQQQAIDSCFYRCGRRGSTNAFPLLDWHIQRRGSRRPWCFYTHWLHHEEAVADIATNGRPVLEEMAPRISTNADTSNQVVPISRASRSERRGYVISSSTLRFREADGRRVSSRLFTPVTMVWWAWWTSEQQMVVSVAPSHKWQSWTCGELNEISRVAFDC